jgi:hypothetical protein
VIYYSIIPLEVVFGPTLENQQKKFIEIDYLGEKVEVMPTENNKYVINRLISTSPKAYLNPKLQPGSIIEGKL